MPTPKSPLFQEASRQVKRLATRQFQRSAMGQLAQQVHTTAKRATKPGDQVHRAMRYFSRSASPDRVLRDLMGAEFGQLVTHLERYAKRDSGKQRAVQDFLGSIGPTGKLIQSLIGGGGPLKREIRLAVDLIRAFGGEVLPGDEWGTTEDVSRGLQAAQKRLEEFGVEFVPPEETQKRRELFSEEQKQYGVRSDHPMLTGEMVRTPNSTNVYEFAYDLESLYLYIRFQADDSGGPGPLYRYHGVTPPEFKALYQTRNGGNGTGPGVWVWDALRVRGTIHGHQKDYALVGVMGDYVPRKATVRPVYQTVGKRGQELKRPRKIGEEPWYQQRTVRTHSGRMATSVLPTARATGPSRPR